MKKNSEGFEEKLENLSTILETLESGELTLTESLDKFENGISLYSSCIEILEKASEKVSILKTNLDIGELEKEAFIIKED